MSAADEIDRRLLPCVDAAQTTADMAGATVTRGQLVAITLTVLATADQHEAGPLDELATSPARNDDVSGWTA